MSLEEGLTEQLAAAQARMGIALGG
jgi:hypothetical protein